MSLRKVFFCMGSIVNQITNNNTKADIRNSILPALSSLLFCLVSQVSNMVVLSKIIMQLKFPLVGHIVTTYCTNRELFRFF